MTSRPRQRLWDLSVAHCLSRSVRDSAALLAETEQSAGTAGAFAPVGMVSAPDRRRLKVALTLESYLGAMTHPEVRKAIADTAKLCAELGHKVEHVKLPFDGQLFWDSLLPVWAEAGMDGVQGLSKIDGLARRN